MKKWYQIKEQAAGEKRLWFSWYVYRIFGKKALYLIAFVVTFFTFIFAKDIRKYSKKYLTIISPLCGIKPSLFNQFKHFLSYSFVLADKVEIFANKFDKSHIKFASEVEKELFYNDFYKKKGLFCMCSHVGNTDVMRSFFMNSEFWPKFRVNIFLSQTQSQVFNNFISKIAKQIPINYFYVEEIRIDTSITLKESLDQGSVAFIAGDRIAESKEAKVFEAELFGHKVDFPIGSFKIVQLMEVPVYFVIAIKSKGDTYTIHLQKHNLTTLEDMEQAYVKFLERITLQNPLQFYHFYDLFKD